jgi:hypothetical protein
MKGKLHWIAAGAALAACLAFVVLKSSSTERIPIPLAARGRPADLPPPDPSKITQALKLSPNAIDFGEIAVGERKTLMVEVQNTGKKPVTVYRSVFSCPCLSGGVDENTIPAGKSATLSVSFVGTPGKRSYRTFASIVTDEEGPCKYDLLVEGKVQQEFIVEPETVAFGILEKGATKTIDAVIRRRDGAAFAIKDVKLSRPEFEIRSDPAKGGKAPSHRLSVTARAARAEAVVASATVEALDFPPEGAPILTLSLEVPADFLCTPSIAVANLDAGGKPKPFETSVRGRLGGKVKVDGVREGQNRKIEFTQSEQADGSCVVRIAFPDGYPAGAPFGDFILSVGGESEAVHLPYRIEAPAAKSPNSP